MSDAPPLTPPPCPRCASLAAVVEACANALCLVLDRDRWCDTYQRAVAALDEARVALRTRGCRDRH